MKILKPPVSRADVEALEAGDKVLITGIIYTGRDAAHKRLVDLLDKGEALPFDVDGSIIFYVGPAPAQPGRPIGSAGPTTSYRMDAYAPRLIAIGLRGMIGKGPRAPQVIEAMKQYGCVYLGATGGAGALLARAVKKSDVIAFPDLGPEAIHRLEVEEFPVIVINDTKGNDLYKQNVEKYRKD